MKRAPITKQRSSWTPTTHVDYVDTAFGDVVLAWHRRNVNDGVLLASVSEEPHGWHLSISFRDHRGEHTRYPRWDEIAHARDELLPADIDFVMHLPRTDDYLAVHPTTFHLHEHPRRRP